MQFATVLLLGSSLGQPQVDGPKVQFSQTRRIADVIVLEWTTNQAIIQDLTRVDFRIADQPESQWRQVMLPETSKSGVKFSAGTLDPLIGRVTVTDVAGRTGEGTFMFAAESPVVKPPTTPYVRVVVGGPCPPPDANYPIVGPRVSLVLTADANSQPKPSGIRWQQVMTHVFGSHFSTSSLQQIAMPLSHLPRIDPHLAASAGAAAMKGGMVALQVALHVAAHALKK
jgi:hypothetical protein